MRTPGMILLLVIGCAALAADKPATPLHMEGSRAEVYKTVGDVTLRMHIFDPAGHKPTDKTPAIIFFFGGGWNHGAPSQFEGQCRYLASRGMVAMSAEYRTKEGHGTTPYECVMDGKSALRWARKNAAALGIDPDHIAAGGGSAGGHVAAAVATVPGLNEPGEDTAVSCVPDALVLFNPVYDNGPKGYGYSRVKERYKEISPIDNIRPGIPPAIVFLGTKDTLIPVATAQKFQSLSKAAGGRSDLMLYEGGAHGFYNESRGVKYYRLTMEAMDRFLASLGFLSGEPAVEKE